MIFKQNGQEVTALHFTPPTSRADGQAYGASDHGGYNIYVDGQTFVSIPNDYGINSWPLDQMGIVSVGSVTIQLSTVDSAGRESLLSDPIVIEVEVAVPKPPTGLYVS